MYIFKCRTTLTCTDNVCETHVEINDMIHYHKNVGNDITVRNFVLKLSRKYKAIPFLKKILASRKLLQNRKKTVCLKMNFV